MAPSSVIDNSSNRPILWQLRPNALSEGDEEEWQEYDEPEGENPHVVDGLTYTLMATGLVDIPQPPSKRVNEETRVIDPTRTPGKPYMHEAIDPTNEIRILTLLPFETDELRCTLGTARLVDKPFYEALSYVWGNPVFDDFIQIGDEELAITSSLGIALRNLRHTDRPRQLWIGEMQSFSTCVLPTNMQ